MAHRLHVMAVMAVVVVLAVSVSPRQVSAQLNGMPLLTEMVVSESFTVVPGAIGVGTATCPSGTRAISGGFGITQGNPRTTSELLASYPAGLDWVIELHNLNFRQALEFEVHAVCAR